jgi:hypothetical protein
VAPLSRQLDRIGFRKWYERQLLTSHAHMVLAFLAVIALLASLEASRGADAGVKLANVAMSVACAGIGIWAIRRYLYLLMRAENTANQANCPGCGEYGRFRVVTEHAGRDLDVCCHRCAREWKILPEDDKD